MRQVAFLVAKLVLLATPAYALADVATAGPVRIADTSTSVPGVAAQFAKFSYFPSLRGGDVLFSGPWSVPGENGQGMYLYDGASVIKIVDSSDQRPDRPGTSAERFTSPLIRTHRYPALPPISPALA